MERNPMSRIINYRGAIVEYTGIPDEQAPVCYFWDNRNDCPRIMISASLSPFIIEAIADCVIENDNEGLQKILENEGLKEYVSEPSGRMADEILKILSKEKF